MKRVSLAVLAFALAMPIRLYAEVIEVEYKRFYSHVNKLNDEDTSELQFAFGFLNVRTQQLCVIKSAEIVTQKKTLPLTVTPEYRFTVPTEKALKLADAKVYVDLDHPANICDMSVQLETKPSLIKQTYTQEELQAIRAQYAAFFNEMGSFLSFMMPSVKGLMIHFEEQDLSRVIGKDLAIQQGMLIIHDEQLNAITELTLPTQPMRITALASR